MYIDEMEGQSIYSKVRLLITSHLLSYKDNWKRSLSYPVVHRQNANAKLKTFLSRCATKENPAGRIAKDAHTK